MTDKAISPLRKRMIEDMTIRKFAPKTQHDYLQRVKNFATYLGRSPDTASSEDVRRYQLRLTASGVGVPTVNQTVSTLRFLFKVTLGRPDLAVSAAKRATLTTGATLIEQGWPVIPLSDTAGLDPALVLSIIRQESAFEVRALSRAS